MSTTKGKRVEFLSVRVTAGEKSRIEHLAQTYAGGSITMWMLHAAINAPREFLVQPKRKGTKSRSP